MTETIGIIGFGRFGQFWAKTLRSEFNVLVSDPQDHTERANALGVEYVGLEALCARSSVIFVAPPINHVEDALKALKPHLKAGTTVFDLCSVKSYPARLMEEYLGDLGLDLIACHPMFGPDSAAEGLDGLNLIIWSLGEQSEAYTEWFNRFKAMRLNVIEMSPDEHDRLAANSQGIAHYIGRVLGEMTLTETQTDTLGFKALLTLIEQTCNDSWELFHDLQNYNPYTKSMRLQLEEALNQVYDRLLPEHASESGLMVGIQGGKGSFNEEACRHYCAENQIKDYRIEYLYTSDNVLDSLHRGEIDRGVFAIQNARGGVVMETIHALSTYRCELVETFDIVINHCILHHPEANFTAVDKLISHPQALAQCQGNLAEKYPALSQISGEDDLIDQANCAAHIAEGKLPPTTAVLAPKVCADLFGLAIHECDLQDMGDANLTTFAWVQRRRYFE